MILFDLLKEYSGIVAIVTIYINFLIAIIKLYKLI